MRSAAEMYPLANGWFYDYQPIVDACGDVLLQVDQDAYQGDTWAIVGRGEERGYLCFGWGSCSGCDALQACESLEEVQQLADGIESSIHWEPNAEALLGWFATKDWDLTYEWRLDDFKKFHAEAIALLSREAGVVGASDEGFA